MRRSKTWREKSRRSLSPWTNGANTYHPYLLAFSFSHLNARTQISPSQSASHPPPSPPPPLSPGSNSPPPLPHLPNPFNPPKPLPPSLPPILTKRRRRRKPPRPHRTHPLRRRRKPTRRKLEIRRQAARRREGHTAGHGWHTDKAGRAARTWKGEEGHAAAGGGGCCGGSQPGLGVRLEVGRGRNVRMGKPGPGGPPGMPKGGGGMPPA